MTLKRLHLVLTVVAAVLAVGGCVPKADPVPTRSMTILHSGACCPVWRPITERYELEKGYDVNFGEQPPSWMLLVTTRAYISTESYVTGPTSSTTHIEVFGYLWPGAAEPGAGAESSFAIYLDADLFRGSTGTPIGTTDLAGLTPPGYMLAGRSFTMPNGVIGTLLLVAPDRNGDRRPDMGKPVLFLDSHSSPGEDHSGRSRDLAYALVKALELR